MDAAERREILNRYANHTRRFDELAARRKDGAAEVIPFSPPLRELEQEPTMREIEVLQLISDGLVNREIGQRLFLSEETVKSHVRHLLAKLQARSRAHAVAVGFRRGIINSPRARAGRRAGFPAKAARRPLFDRFPQFCGNPSTEGCPLFVENRSYVGFTSPVDRRQGRRGTRSALRTDALLLLVGD